MFLAVRNIFDDKEKNSTKTEEFTSKFLLQKLHKNHIRKATNEKSIERSEENCGATPFEEERVTFISGLTTPTFPLIDPNPMEPSLGEATLSYILVNLWANVVCTTIDEPECGMVTHMLDVCSFVVV